MAEYHYRFSRILTPEGWKGPLTLTLDDAGIITAVLENTPPGQAEIRIDGPVIPGMPNLHSHAFQRAMAGLAGSYSDSPDSFWTWRREMYRLAGSVSPDQLQAIAGWLYLEMLRAGFTSCAEFHYLHHQQGGAPHDDLAEMSVRLMQAGREAGLPLTLLPVLYCRSGFGANSVTDQQARFFNGPERYLQLIEDCEAHLARFPEHELGIAPHSLRAVSRSQLSIVLDALGNRAMPIHIHIAEQPGEVEDCLSHTGSRPVRFLLDHFDVDSRWCLVHSTHMDQPECSAAASTGAIAGLCPTTEADLGDGLFSLEHWLEQGGAIGLGSDSNLRVCAAEELRLLEFGARLDSGQRNILAREGLSTGRFGWQACVAGGAAALHQPVAGLAPGQRADFLELDPDHPQAAGKQDDVLLDSFVFAGGRDMIRSVWVAGARVIDHGVHEREAELRSAFSEAVRTLIR